MPSRLRSRALNGAGTYGRPPFSKTLPMLLLAAREAVTQRFRYQTQEYGLTEQQWRVIRALAEVDSLEIHALSAQCRIHAASLSRILPKLHRDGLIARHAKAADQRCVVVSLTPRGLQLIDDTWPQASRVYEQLAHDIGAERLAHVYAVLEEFIALLEASRPDASASDDGAPTRPAGKS